MFRSSPSSIGLTQLCVARAVAKYVWGYEEPETEPMREGTRLHRITQAYLRDGTVPDSNEKAAHAMIKVLPLRAASVAPSDIERVVLLPEHHGYIDWSHGKRHGDLKFTKNVRYQCAKDPTTDSQRIMYAVDAFERDRGLVSLKQYWSISQFDGTKALTLKHTWTKLSAQAAYDATVRPIHDKLAHAIETKMHWNDAPKNLASCDTYPPDGCMMKKQGCRRSLSARLQAIRPKQPKDKTV